MKCKILIYKEKNYESDLVSFIPFNKLVPFKNGVLLLALLMTQLAHGEKTKTFKLIEQK